MKIYSPTKYFGHNIKGQNVIDRDNSGVYILGIYTNIENTAVCLMKLFLDEKIHVVKESVSESIYDESPMDEIHKFIKDYEIKCAFGNLLGKSICNLKDSFSSHDKSQYEGYEVADLSPEQAYLTVRHNINCVSFNREIKYNWDKEISNFSIDKLVFSRLYALASVLKNVKPYTTMLDDCAPDILVDDQGFRINEEIERRPSARQFISSIYKSDY